MIFFPPPSSSSSFIGSLEYLWLSLFSLQTYSSGCVWSLLLFSLLLLDMKWVVDVDVWAGPSEQRFWLIILLLLPVLLLQSLLCPRDFLFQLRSVKLSVLVPDKQVPQRRSPKTTGPWNKTSLPRHRGNRLSSLVECQGQIDIRQPNKGTMVSRGEERCALASVNEKRKYKESKHDWS